jgi:hypothetical protein
MSDESALSLVLRTFHANAVDYEEGMRWMGLDRRNALSERDVIALAWGVQADVDDLRKRLVLLESTGGGRWVHLAGQRISRWIAPTTMQAKLCPVCLRETGFARIGWLIRAVPACLRHGHSITKTCTSCGGPIRWVRPAVHVCQCGRFFKPVKDVEQLEPELLPWLRWTEALLRDDASSAAVATTELPVLLHDLSLDGAYRLVEAFGLLDRPGASVRDVRHGSTSLSAISEMLVRGIRRLSSVASAEDARRMDFSAVHLPVLRELAESPASDGDGRRAAWLLDLHRTAQRTDVARVGARPRGQLPLFL